MASDLNITTLIGRLTRDPEIRYTQGGQMVASFSVAVNRSYTSNGQKVEQVSYFNCVAWAKLAEIISEYIFKGHRIALQGYLQRRAWDDKDGNKRSTVELVVQNMQMLQPKSAANGAQPPPTNEPDQGDLPYTDNDIPF